MRNCFETNDDLYDDQSSAVQDEVSAHVETVQSAYKDRSNED